MSGNIFNKVLTASFSLNYKKPQFSFAYMQHIKGSVTQKPHTFQTDGPESYEEIHHVSADNKFLVIKKMCRIDVICISRIRQV